MNKDITHNFKLDGKNFRLTVKPHSIRHDVYPTAELEMNKVDACTDPGAVYYFVFNYTDGCYYIEYDKELFATFELGENNGQKIIYIPISLMKKGDDVSHKYR